MNTLMPARLCRFALAVLSAVLLTLAASAPSVSAAPLPSRFGNHGRVLTAFPGLDARGAGVVRDPRGRLVVAGTASSPGGSDIALARYLPNGRLDPSFGAGQTVTRDLGGDEQVRDIALDSRGRIVVAGYSGFVYTPAADEGLGQPLAGVARHRCWPARLELRRR